MYAYDYNLFSKAQMSLAWMFDYGVIDCRLALQDFYDRFLISTISKKFERGDSSVVAGMSGIEMAMSVISETDSCFELPSPRYELNRTKEYWLGWALAYYQWANNIPFSNITENINIDVIAQMYNKYHEMDIRHFAERLDEMRRETRTESAMRRLRRYAGLSQSELAKSTDIPLKTIQAYEQGQKSINNARVDYVLRIAKALDCNVELLLEQ